MIPCIGFGQNKEDYKRRYFELAKTRSFAKQYDSAEVYLNKAIQLDAKYLEARTFKVRNFAYQDKTAAAVAEAKEIIKIDRRHTPVYHALSDAYIWSEQHQEALNTVSNGLFYAPSDVELLEKKSELEYKLGKKQEASETVKTLLYYDPTNDIGQELQTYLRKDLKSNNVGIIYNFDSYDNILGNANALTYYFKKDAPKGPWLLKINQAIRSGRTGLQFEGDWYPKLTKKTYLYLNAGFSASDLFPGFRAGAEIYTDLGKSWEGSIGFRYLYFDLESQSVIPNTQPVLLTAQAGKYWGNNWFSGRVFLAFDTQESPTRSLILQYRRYITNRDHFFGLMGATGFVPDNRVGSGTTAYDVLTGAPIYYQRTRRIGFTYQQPLNTAWFFRFALGVGEQESSIVKNDFDSFVFGTLQLNYKF